MTLLHITVPLLKLCEKNHMHGLIILGFSAQSKLKLYANTVLIKKKEEKKIE